MSDEQSLKISHVSVEGNKRMRTSFFAKEMAAARLTTTNYSSMDDMATAISSTCRQLQSRDLFHDVSADINVPERLNPRTGQMEPALSDVQVRFRVEEKQVPHVIANTYVQPGSSSGVCCKVETGFRSPLGIGEKFAVGAERSQSGMTTYNAQLDVPHVGPRLDNLSILATRSDDDCSFYQSFRNISDSLTATLSPRDGRRSVVATFVARDEVPVQHHAEAHARDVTGGVLGVASSSTKASVRCGGTLFDTRDRAALPERGGMAEATVEVALPPGTAHFAKAEVTWQHTVPLGPRVLGQTGLLCTLAGNAGLLLPFAALFPGRKAAGSNSPIYSSQQQKNMRTYLVDRFTLGGPLGLRGFDLHGVGARSGSGREHVAGAGPGGVAAADSRSASASNGTAAAAAAAAASLSSPADSLGGISKASLSAVFSVPLPFRDLAHVLDGVRAIGFVCVGSMGSPAFWPRWRHNRDCGNDPRLGALPGLPLFGMPRVSVGGGLCLALNGNMRLELTYSVPVTKTRHDLVRPFQLGIGWTVG